VNYQLKEATRQNCISRELKQLCKELLQFDTEFQMIFSSSRGQYTRIRFTTTDVSTDVRKWILITYGKGLWQFLKPIK